VMQEPVPSHGGVPHAFCKTSSRHQLTLSSFGTILLLLYPACLRLVFSPLVYSITYREKHLMRSLCLVLFSHRQCGISMYAMQKLCDARTGFISVAQYGPCSTVELQYTLPYTQAKSKINHCTPMSRYLIQDYSIHSH